MPYEYIDKWAKADQAFRAWGKTLEEVFQSAVDAILGIMVSHPEKIRPYERRRIILKESSPEFLLYSLLKEIIFFKDSEGLLLRLWPNARDTIISPDAESWILDAVLEGERIETYDSEFLVDVKAVTLHRFSLHQTMEGWEATVVVDI